MAHHPGQPSVEGPEQHLSAGRGRPPRRTAAHQHHPRHRRDHNYLVSLVSLRSSAEGGPELFGNICWTLSGSVLISECCSPIDYSISFSSISFLKRTDV